MTIVTFQRARNEQQRQIRLQQITTAMIDLMQTLPFDKITMKKLGEQLSFTRNNLYQYVKSKNEVILLIIQQDFANWVNDLQNEYSGLNKLSVDQFCEHWAKVASQYPRILHWFPLLGELIEKDVELEKLIPFKKNFFNVMQKAQIIITNQLPLNSNQAEHIVYFYLRTFPHLFHLFHESTIQKKALQAVGINGPEGTFCQQATLELKIYINGILNTTF